MVSVGCQLILKGLFQVPLKIFNSPLFSSIDGNWGNKWIYEGFGAVLFKTFELCRGDRSGYHFMEKNHFFKFHFLTLQANFFAFLAPFSSIIYGILAKFMIFGDFGPF